MHISHRIEVSVRPLILVRLVVSLSSPDDPVRSRQYVRRDLPIFDFRLLDHRITRSALAKTLGGITSILDLRYFDTAQYRFWILDSMSHNCSHFTLTELLCLLVPAC